MASNKQAPTVVVMALILITAANPLSHAQLFEPIIPGGVRNGVLLSGLNASGRFCCTANGNCPDGAAGVAGVPVSLKCTNLVGVGVTVGQNTTGGNGGYSISAPNVVGLLGGLLNSTALPCTVGVQLPLDQTLSCPVLSAANGSLTGAVSTVNIVGGVGNGIAGNTTVILIPALPT